MYARIGRLAILHISNVTFICTLEKKKKDVAAISGMGQTVESFLTSNTWPTSLYTPTLRFNGLVARLWATHERVLPKTVGD